MTIKEIETRQLALLKMKHIKTDLTPDELVIFNKLNKKYRTRKGKLLKGSFYVDSNSKWAKAS